MAAVGTIFNVFVYDAVFGRDSNLSQDKDNCFLDLVSMDEKICIYYLSRIIIFLFTEKLKEQLYC